MALGREEVLFGEDSLVGFRLSNSDLALKVLLVLDKFRRPTPEDVWQPWTQNTTCNRLGLSMESPTDYLQALRTGLQCLEQN
ncbi:hypothetical protein H6P81_016001 [Aristolochia fimbriata]|uniref:Uncharacterized protein n=1 Tax=Aristolochia fimbriata TaxID=158543 RepID=A0AAV7EA44_ARIFI|nr:hypothetical protein H6P81_016001 [Aristolochia fimbriata]